MKTIRLAGLLLWGLTAGCAPRLYLRRPPCDAGMRLENETTQLTFRKQDVLEGAAIAARRYQTSNPAFAQQIIRLQRRYAADTVQLTTVPDLHWHKGWVGIDSTGLYNAELFFIVDEYLLKQRRFCALDKKTNRQLIWVRLHRFKYPDDIHHVLVGPDGKALYSILH